MAYPAKIRRIASPEQILDRLRAGESTTQIARSLGVTHQSLQAWLLVEDAEQYHEAITMALAHRVAAADEALEACDGKSAIARVATARFARMDLERRRPALYGQRQEITVRAPVLDIAFGRSSTVALQQQSAPEQRTIDVDVMTPGDDNE